MELDKHISARDQYQLQKRRPISYILIELQSKPSRVTLLIPQPKGDVCGHPIKHVEKTSEETTNFLHSNRVATSQHKGTSDFVDSATKNNKCKKNILMGTVKQQMYDEAHSKVVHIVCVHPIGMYDME